MLILKDIVNIFGKPIVSDSESETIRWSHHHFPQQHPYVLVSSQRIQHLHGGQPLSFQHNYSRISLSHKVIFLYNIKITFMYVTCEISKTWEFQFCTSTDLLSTIVCHLSQIRSIILLNIIQQYWAPSYTDGILNCVFHVKVEILHTNIPHNPTLHVTDCLLSSDAWPYDAW